MAWMMPPISLSYGHYLVQICFNQRVIATLRLWMFSFWKMDFQRSFTVNALTPVKDAISLSGRVERERGGSKCPVIEGQRSAGLPSKTSRQRLRRPRLNTSRLRTLSLAVPNLNWTSSRVIITTVFLHFALSRSSLCSHCAISRSPQSLSLMIPIALAYKFYKDRFFVELQEKSKLFLGSS